MAELDPALLLEGETSRLIDEWQLILTGSSTPAADRTTSHSGTVRISRMAMRPMTLYESGDSNGSISLGELFCEQNEITVKSVLYVRRIAYLICRGGWPRTHVQSEKITLKYGWYDE